MNVELWDLRDGLQFEYQLGFNLLQVEPDAQACTELVCRNTKENSILSMDLFVALKFAKQANPPPGLEPFPKEHKDTT